MTNNQLKKTLALLNLLAYGGTVVVNTLANAIPIGGVTTGQVSDRLGNLFTPSGWTFSIWGLIYLWLLLFVIEGLRGAFRPLNEGDGNVLLRIGPWFLWTSAGNMAWIVAWHNGRIGLSLVCILVMLSGLIMSHLRIPIHYDPKGTVRRLRLMVYAPISIYLGWVTVATVANVTAWLVSLGVTLPLPDTFWLVVAVTLALGINLLAVQRSQDVFFASVGVWALGGILSARWADPASGPGIVALLALYMVVLAGRILINRRAFGGDVR